MTEVLVLGNPAARGGTGDVERVVDVLRARGRRATMLTADSAAAAGDAARAAVADGAERLVVVGGDGLVRIAVDAVAGSPTVLGIVPQGTGNDFARALGLLGGDLGQHVTRALADPAAVDAVRTGHGWVASVATSGFSGDVTARANALRWPRGQQRYTVATFLQLGRLRRLHARITIDGEVHEADNTLLAIGNTAYFGGGMRICPDARPDDGLLHVVVIGPVPVTTFLKVFPRVFRGGHVRHPAVSTYTGRVVSVEGEDCEMWADGDLLGPLPLTCEAVAGALQVAGATT
ncbi:MAG: diacylglycerol/lipid kinase family protein [Acidimicrobiia bacterium]